MVAITDFRIWESSMSSVVLSGLSEDSVVVFGRD